MSTTDTLRRRCSTGPIQRRASGSAGGSPSPATSPSTTSRRGAPRARARLGAGARLRGRHRDGLSRTSTAARARPAARVAGFETLAFGDLVAAGQVRRPVRAVRRRGPAPRHRAPPRALPARRRAARAPRLLRDDRDRPRLQRAGARDDRDLRPGRRRSSSSTRRTTTRARTTSATPRATAAWRSCSRS